MNFFFQNLYILYIDKTTKEDNNQPFKGEKSSTLQRRFHT